MNQMESLNQLIEHMLSFKSKNDSSLDEYAYIMAHTNTQDLIWVTIECATDEFTYGVMAWIPRGSSIDTIRKWFHLPDINGANYKRNGRPCNKFEAVYENDDIIAYQ
ncbi:MAG: hypothetical protein WCT49_06225 [Candidatus Paceibacterota bacterium]|jgi:hypothetical protein